ncbi:hypothetical protein [Nonomuraea dietziae]|uniref:Gram-positive cocci surface proteins LPxTG domain-containing protein n=1 Tax=Nonomuraea dietziae TaxID=65515 RepID=A0A7W5V462_9ACTN|nr:hypothetical protein [Nonomuraea dietziae]MBB3728699.1 hypothetical protein [Nonomuraea dietziae]
MQKSKARRRLALKTSALGLAGTLALFVGSIVGLASPAEAAAEVAAAPSMTVTFNCVDGPFGGNPVTATISGPESVAPGGSVELKWAFTVKPKAGRTVTAGTMTIEGDVNVATIASPTVTAQKTAVPVPALNKDQEFSTVPELLGTFTAPTTAGQLTVTPVPVATGGSLFFTLSTSDETECTYVPPTTGTAPSMVIPVNTGGGGGTGGDTVSYKCATQSSGDPKDATITVAMTLPTAAKANEEQTVPATYTGGQLTVPTGGFTTGAKFIATASVSGAGVSGTSVTAEAALTTLTAGSPITFPSVSFKVKPTTAGTVTLKASDIYFGTSTSVYQYKCTVQASPVPKSHTFTVTAASTSPSPSPSPSASTSASVKPTRTVTATVTQTPVGGGNGKVTKTPKGAAETGGGGDMGPDGRMFVLTGSLVVLAAAAGGLVLRRRSVSRG